MNVKNIKQPENESTLSASNSKRILTDVLYSITVDEVSNLYQETKNQQPPESMQLLKFKWELTRKSDERGASRIFKPDKNKIKINYK